MEKLTKQQLSGISELVHHIRNKEVIQCILETLGRDNWNRDILSNCVRYLNDEQDNVFESLGGGYSSEEIDEILYNDDLNFEISEQLKEMGVTRYLYENEEYIEDIRKGTIICEGINVEEIKKNLEEIDIISKIQEENFFFFMHEEKETLKYVLEADKALIAQGTDWLREKYGAEYLYRAVRCYEIKLKEDAAESIQTTLKECNQKLNRYEDFEYSISNHSAWVKKEDKYGFVDNYANEIVPCTYDSVCLSEMRDGLWGVCKDGKWGCIDKEGKVIVPLTYSAWYEMCDNMACYEDISTSILNGWTWVKKEGKYGFVDINGNEIVPCIYDNVCFSVPHENLWAVCKDNKWGYINKEGEEVIPFRFKQATNFNGRRAEVVTFEDECFNIDFAGNRIEE